jgi:hypothetical protein
MATDPNWKFWMVWIYKIKIIIKKKKLLNKFYDRMKF